MDAISTAELALRLSALRGTSVYLAYLVPREHAPMVASDLAEEAKVGEAMSARVLRPRDGETLLATLGTATDELAIIDACDFQAGDWSLLDRRRSSLARRGVTVILTTPESFDALMRTAANLSSWIGALAFSHHGDAAELAELRRQRLASLRQWSGKTDDEVVRAAQDGDLSPDPEFAEWLVLIGRGDLLDGRRP